MTIAGVVEKGAALRVKISSVLIYDIAGKGFTRFKAAPGHEAVPLTQGETVQARFFVFDRQPSMDRLMPPNPNRRCRRSRACRPSPETVDRVYWYA